MATITISGTDSNLGTITSDIEYSVTTDSGNSISLTRIVNNIQVATRTVKTGFSYSIPITDLPTGTNTIEIIATTDTTSGEISATRTWTYYKTPINIPSTGGIAQLTQNGQNIWPVTVPDAVEAPVYLGGNLNAALNKLGQAALYTKIGSPKYSEVTVDLSKVSVGDEVLLPYNNVMVPHIVVHIGNPNPSLYDASCNGVWLLRKDCVAQGRWNSTNVNTLAGSTIMSVMAEYISNYSSEVQSAIKTVKIPYCVGGGSTTVNKLSNGLSCKLFPLGYYELGVQIYSYLPKDGAKLDFFNNGIGPAANNKRISYFNEVPTIWWTRTPDNNGEDVGIIGANGSADSYGYPLQSNAYRPCFIMPTTFNHTYYVDSFNNIYPSQEYTQGGSITDVFGYDVPIAQTEVGTYVGNGQYGGGNPNSLTFSFEPKFVCITDNSVENGRAIIPYKGNGITWAGQGSDGTPLNGYRLNTTWTTNGLSWYNSGSNIWQMNKSGVTYQYVAFG